MKVLKRIVDTLDAILDTLTRIEANAVEKEKTEKFKEYKRPDGLYGRKV